MNSRNLLTEQILQGGVAVLVHTMTGAHVGRVVHVDDQWLELHEASWVPDTGRWHEALSTGTLDEVEPHGDGRVVLNRAGIGHAVAWNHPLPTEAR